MSTAQVIARHLLSISAVKLQPDSPFTWASGMRSPIYCDNRVTLTHPVVRTVIKQSLLALAKTYQGVDLIAGVATAGVAHGALLADAMGLPYIYVRSKAKAHGRQNLIEGEVRPGSKVLVIEDLISTGGSSIAAVEALRAEHMEVAAVLSIFDYGFATAKENFTNAACLYASLCDYPTLLQEAVYSNYITSEQLDILKDWNANPQDWFKNTFN